ncbi:MAG: PhnD/SsuA/transferrin family substrate-binding protein [Proteobacteria bacterium]|nr:PhnD/SsuA/transferrin family substrate-binding protein [Pseudomonadota bacterium]
MTDPKSILKGMIQRLIAFLFVALSVTALAAGISWAEDNHIKIGVLASRGPQQCLKRWKPTADYLTRKIYPEKFVIVPIDYKNVYSTVEKESIDFILVNPSIYVDLEYRYGVSRIATLKQWQHYGGDYAKYGGVIFCKKIRDDIRNLHDLKGKTFMAVDKTSFGGWRMVWRELKEKGIDPAVDFKELRFGGNEDAVVFAVKDGTIDAGTVRSNTLETMDAEGKIFLENFYVINKQGGVNSEVPFLSSTRVYPEWPFAKVRHTSDAVAEKVATALLEIPPDSLAALYAQCAGWTIPLNYQSVHECLKELKIGPYKNLGKITLSDVVRTYWHVILVISILFLVMAGSTIIILNLNRNINASHLKLQTEMDEHKQAEEALRESELKYRTLFESTPDAIMMLNKDGFFDCNASTLKIFNCSSKKEFVNCHPGELSPPEQPEGQDSFIAADEHIEKAFAEGSDFYEWMHQRKDGAVFPAEVLLSRFELGGRMVLQALVREVTERKRAEEQIHTLTQQLMKVQEEERQKISRDLHDHVAQDLSTLRIGCDTLFDNQPKVSPEIKQRVSKFLKLLQGTIVAVRDMAYDLRPPGLDQLGLVRTVFQYCEDFSDRNGVSVDFYSAGVNGLRLDFDTEINLYRLIQEALNNIRKHADASQVAIRLISSFPNIILRMEDDGRGFDIKERLVTALTEKRMGLQNMAERVNLLQGKMRIQSRPKEGTKILIEVPYKEAKSGSKEEHLDH